MPEHDANLIVFRSVIQQIGQCDVHGRRHRVFLLRPIQLNPQDVSRTLSNNVTHNIDLLCYAGGWFGCWRGWAGDSIARLKSTRSLWGKSWAHRNESFERFKCRSVIEIH